MQGPVLAVHGSLDPVIPVANAHHFAGVVPGAVTVIVEGMGHIITPETCTEMLRAFKQHGIIK